MTLPSAPPAVNVLRRLAANRHIDLTEQQAEELLAWTDGHIVAADQLLGQMQVAYGRRCES